MKATTHFRRRGNEVLLFYLVVPAMLFGQGVRIHERVEISPSPSPIQAGVPWQASITGNTDHRIIITASWDKPVEGNIYMKRDFGPSAPCSETTLASGISQIAVDTPLSAGNYQFKLFICVAQLAPSQACSASFSVMIDEQQIGRQSWVVYGGSSAIWESIGTIGYNSPYVSTFTFKIDRKTMYYEEGNLLRVSATNDCRLGTFDLAKDIVQLEIVGGAVYAQFFNFDTWQMAGTSVSGLVSGLQKYSLVANGSKPDPAGSTVSIRASSGSLSYTETVTIVPYYFRVTADTPRVYAGGGTSIKILTVNGAGEIYNRPASPVVRIGLTDNNDYGTLWYGIPDWGVLQEGDTVEGVESMYLSDPSAGTEVDFLANERQPKDSVVVKFNVEKIDEGSSPNNWSPWVWPHQGIDPITGMGEVTVLRGKEQEFSGFKILISRDTLKNRQVSSVTVIAVDKDSNEVEIEAETPVNLSFNDFLQYVDFISITGDTLDALTNVPYSILRAGQVKIIARGTQAGPVITAALAKIRTKVNSQSTMSVASQGYSNTYPKIGILAEASIDLTKQGYRDFFIKPEVKVIAVADSIKPSYPGHIAVAESQTELKVAVTVSGILYSSPLQYRVEIASFAVQGSGGHSHQGDRPTGRFIDGTDAIPVLYTQTTGDTIRAVYRASLFGGKEKIFARLTDLTPANADTDSVVVRVPDLRLLPAGINYRKVGGLCTHHGPSDNDTVPDICRTPDDNHWGTSRLIQIVQAVADSLAAKYPSYELRVNDMSLPFGGKYEINGSWNANADHQEHRMGTNADVNLDVYINGTKGYLNSRQKRRLWVLIRDLAGRTPLDETDRNHYHIR
jgi:hypothetical protein